MLVYGDHADRVEPRAVMEELRRRIARGSCGTWVLVEAGRLVQGLLDAASAESGEDECTPLAATCAELMVSLVSRDGARARTALERIGRHALPDQVILKVPEGYAFYAIYPELYARAASELPGAVQAIGIRSIGTGLGAIVAATAGGPTPIFVRPVGDPFRRQLRLGKALRDRLASQGSYAIADEGPGLSGSSFLCVARALLSGGAPAARIHLFPSHGSGPGPEATCEDRRLWEALPQHWRPFETLLEHVPFWCEHLTGTARLPVEDLSGGRWRAGSRIHAPADVRNERRKFLVRTDQGTFLLKFAGLGAAGDGVLRRAHALSDGAFSPPVLGLANGFLVSRWMDARPVAPGPPLLERAAEYVAFRSRALPAGSEAGASPERLLEMARRNAGLALGQDAVLPLERWRPLLPALTREMVRIETDNRMHAWEWLGVGGGRILKADGVDHCRSHDLVGCQDAAWDLAGASIELGLELAPLVRQFHAHGGRGAAPALLAFSRVCYLAFQLGAFALAAQAARGLPEDSARLRAEMERYQALLADELNGSPQ